MSLVGERLREKSCSFSTYEFPAFPVLQDVVLEEERTAPLPLFGVSELQKVKAGASNMLEHLLGVIAGDPLLQAQARPLTGNRKKMINSSQLESELFTRWLIMHIAHT